MIRILILSLLVNFWAANAQPADHRQWTDVLQEYVLENGAVDYKGLQNNKSGLESYLKLLSANAPNDEWSIDAKKHIGSMPIMPLPFSLFLKITP